MWLYLVLVHKSEAFYFCFLFPRTKVPQTGSCFVQKVTRRTKLVRTPLIPTDLAYETPWLLPLYSKVSLDMYFYNAQRTLLANLVPQNIARRLSRQPADLLEIFYFKLEFGAPAGGMHLTKKAWKKERKKVLQICGWALPFFLFLAWAATSSVQCTRTPLHCPMTKYIALRPEHRYGTAHCLDAANLWHRPNGTRTS